MSARLRFFHRLLALRSATLLPETIGALNDSRLVAFALALRGLLETAAVAAYHASKLVILAEATTVPAGFDEALRVGDHGQPVRLASFHEGSSKPQHGVFQIQTIRDKFFRGCPLLASCESPKPLPFFTRQLTGAPISSAF